MRKPYTALLTYIFIIGAFCPLILWGQQFKLTFSEKKISDKLQINAPFSLNSNFHIKQLTTLPGRDKTKPILYVDLGSHPDKTDINIFSIDLRKNNIYLDSLTTLSWRWKIKNAESADGIFIRIYAGNTPICSIASHTSYTFSDILICNEKSGVWNEHKINLLDAFSKSIRNKKLIGRQITKIKFMAIDAVAQGFWLDYLELSRQTAGQSDKVVNGRFVQKPNRGTPFSRPVSVCFGDIDRDNDLDVFIVNQYASNYVKLNNGQGKFSQMLFLNKDEDAFKNSHAIFIDINDDGWPDLFKGRDDSPNQLFINNGNLNFRADPCLRNSEKYFTQTYATLWADFDHNKSLDFIELYPSWSAYDKNPLKKNACLYSIHPFNKINLGLETPYFGGALADVNNDGNYEIFLADNRQQNHLYQLNTDLTLHCLDDSIFSDIPFPQRLNNKNKGYGWTEGGAFFDVDKDGDLDLYVCNDGDPNQLYIWENGRFTEEAAQHNLADSVQSEGFLIADFDNDMDWDIYLLHTKQPHRLMLNDGNGRFYDGTTGSGFEHPGGSVGGACGDVDNDGDIDIYLVDPYRGEQLLINPINNNNFLKLNLRGQPGNYYGIRAKVWLFAGNSLNDTSLVCYHQLTCGDGFQYETFARQFHFGLKANRDYSVRVVFDDQTEMEKEHIKAGQIITLIYPSGNFLYDLFQAFRFQIREPFLNRLRNNHPIVSILIILMVGLIANLLKQFFIHKDWITHLFSISLIFIVSLFMTNLKTLPLWQIIILIAASVYLSQWLLNPIRKFLHRYYVQESSWDRLYEHLKAFRHGGVAINNLDRIIFLFQNLNDYIGDFSPYRNRLSDAIRTYFNQTSWQIKELLYILKDVHWERKTINTIQKTQQQLLKRFELLDKPALDITVYSQSIEPVLLKTKSIEDHIQSIYDRIAHHFSCDPYRIALGTLSAKYSTVQCVIQNKLPTGILAKIKGFELGNIIFDLIENSLRSVPQTRNYTGRIDLHIDNSFIVIDIQDNGMGIPKTRQKQIFEKGYTTQKEDGGFGLYYASEILHKYGGSISILQSAKNKGTTMRIKLRQAKGHYFG